MWLRCENITHSLIDMGKITRRRTDIGVSDPNVALRLANWVIIPRTYCYPITHSNVKRTHLPPLEALHQVT